MVSRCSFIPAPHRRRHSVPADGLDHACRKNDGRMTGVGGSLRPRRHRSRSSPCKNALLNGVDGISHGLDPVRIVVGDLDVEGLLDGERQVYECKRIGTEVVKEGSVEGDALLGNVQPLLNDATDLVVDVPGHGRIIRAGSPRCHGSPGCRTTSPTNRRPSPTSRRRVATLDCFVVLPNRLPT
jgi:hypothetical protein